MFSFWASPQGRRDDGLSPHGREYDERLPQCENTCVHAAVEEPCRWLQCDAGVGKVKAKSLISTGFLRVLHQIRHFCRDFWVF
jgi:hypothetical protein